MAARLSVYDPDLPCVHKTSVAICAGSKIRIRGSIPHDAHRFWIDFQCGLSMCSYVDVAFHLNPRFDHMAVVRNTLINEKWGVEERSESMPLCRGAVFDLLIECNEQSWKVAFNGQHFCEFPHRIQYQLITHMAVYGDVNIMECNLGIGSGPSMAASVPMSYNPDMQCAHKITGGICSSSKIRIQGIIPHDAYRFWIDFQCGPSMNRHDDIAFHISPRFDQMEVVRNTLIAMQWGVEERSGGMPLCRGAVFDMLITCDEQSWKVAINGQDFCEFPHRIQYQRVTHLAVYGDVNIKQICF